MRELGEQSSADANLLPVGQSVYKGKRRLPTETGRTSKRFPMQTPGIWNTAQRNQQSGHG